jgi:hypothetical protein
MSCDVITNFETHARYLHSRCTGHALLVYFSKTRSKQFFSPESSDYVKLKSFIILCYLETLPVAKFM